MSLTPISRDSAAGREPPHLVIESLTAGYGATPIISGISLTMGFGEVVSVLGPNGAGKSTLLKALVGVLPVMSGRVLLGDEDVTGLRTDELARKGVGYVPQMNDVFDALTVLENLEMGGYLLRGSEIRSRVGEVVRLFPALGGMLRRPAGKLSGGERKMLAMGRVLMLNPSVLVLDEPAASLSPELGDRLLKEHIRRLADSGTAVLLVEQRAASALEISDWAHVLVSGTTRLSGAARDLLAEADFAEVYLGRQ
jgi:ABC-type branched-subunit amino acid transport system ATPase component